MSRIQITSNFYLDEFTHSQTAARHGIAIEVEPYSDIYLNIERLCIKVLQPLRDALGPVTVSSGYRPTRVNRLIGGSNTSAHLDALAADFRVSGHSPYAVARWLAAQIRAAQREASDNRSGFAQIDQCIHEFGSWVHVGLARNGQAARQQLLTAYKKPSSIPGLKPKTVYVPGISRIQNLEKRHG